MEFSLVSDALKPIIIPEDTCNITSCTIIADCMWSCPTHTDTPLPNQYVSNCVPNINYGITGNKSPDLKSKGKLNLKYKASDEAKKMYRALQILNPSPELSGEYKCTVSTFEKEESQSKKMVIFGKFRGGPDVKTRKSRVSFEE
ncbi:hypothetical protein RUM44_007025 [Polyplax serrata]|uniref:Uncharacterized protein n=1 Tax=Polyplax serrata TaxID=468196 RepID=A0ABR1AZK5_POLSC